MTMDDSELRVTQKRRDIGLNIPDNWNTVYEFAKWWTDSNMPLLIPQDYEVYVSDDATSIPIFRKGRFQVELYLIYPGPNLPIHEHPGVEVIKMRLNTYDKNCKISNQETSGPTLMKGQSHGAGVNFKNTYQNNEVETQGFPLLAFQKWEEDIPMSTVASRWKGKSVGPKQEVLVRRFKPDAYIKDGYIDVTISMENELD